MLLKNIIAQAHKVLGVSVLTCIDSQINSWWSS